MAVLFNILEVLIVLVPILMTTAFVTIAERKVMASMQRRCGPNAVGVWGLLQPFADALKLLVKEIIIPRQSNSLLFVIGPFITLVFAFIGWAIIPFGEGLAIFDYELGIFFALAVSSLGSYGILISGWAANSKYAFMGGIRSTAQLLSYELVFSSIILILIMFSGSFSLTYIIECQQPIWNVFPLLPIALMFLIAIIAETNRPPMDLPEAESELVAGFMTEHSASVFVFFFLGEYSSLILMSAFMSVFFLGGHHCPDLHKLFYEPIMYAYYYINSLFFNIVSYDYAIETFFNNINNNELIRLYSNPNFCINNPNLHIKNILDFYGDCIDINEGRNYYSNLYINWDYNYISEKMNIELLNRINDGIIYVFNFIKYHGDVNQECFTQFTYKDTLLDFLSILVDKIQGSYILGFKIIIVVFFYIWIRASFPRLRYDQLMSLCWKELLPLVFAYIIFTLCLFYTFDMIPYGTTF